MDQGDEGKPIEGMTFTELKEADDIVLMDRFFIDKNQKVTAVETILKDELNRVRVHTNATIYKLDFEDEKQAQQFFRELMAKLRRRKLSRGVRKNLQLRTALKRGKVGNGGK